MPAIRTENYGEYNDLLESMSTGVSMIEALALMLEFSIRSGEDIRNYSFGMQELLNQQCADLRFIEKALRDQFEEIQISKLTIRNPERIAEWAGTTQYVVNRVVSIATGIVLGPPTERHSETPPYILKSAIGGCDA